MKTLEEILKYEQEHRYEGGDFGINACKESIKRSLEYDKKQACISCSKVMLTEQTKMCFSTKE